ncbi:Glyoxylate/hydroxypyruvate reductase HPR3 [Hibiscus syriacus]|uniref:Glyoxylate/hydroxypyruvate reductase HPR3 n=1 Tax=Hibiscus syriacus TaxID=106335 RepID=A0A6A2WPH3_HIBSY|nr:Glyoxylate/hydroxypyruvate reductase HPR3 [Hibiscus syriacus]
MESQLPQERSKLRTKDLPQVLVMKPPPLLTLFEDKFISTKFQLLKAWESTLPLDQFLTTYAGSVRAVLCSGASPVTPHIIRLLPSVQFVVTASAGINHIDLNECRRLGIAVANAAAVFSDDAADAAVGLLIDVLRKISVADRFVRRGLWPAMGDYPFGSKVIISLFVCFTQESWDCRTWKHRSAVAKRLEAFGCTVLYNSRKPKPWVPYPFYSNVHELACGSDVLVVCCGLTAETRHMINREVMVALGKQGIIVNVARGAIIDEKEMVVCLVHGEIGGAALDVFENEPDVPKQLLQLDNVVLTPHRAVFTPEGFMAACDLVVANLEAFFEDKPLLSPLIDE